MQSTIAFVLLFSIRTISLAADVTVYTRFDYDRAEPGVKPVAVSQFPWKFIYDGWFHIQMTLINKSASVTSINVTFQADGKTHIPSKFPVTYGPRRGEDQYWVQVLFKVTEIQIKVNLYRSNILCSSLQVAEGIQVLRSYEILNNEFKHFVDVSINDYTIVVDLKNKCDVDITPLKAVRRIGDQLSVLCKLPYPIDACRMTVGGVPYRLIPDNLQGDVVYAGQGLKAGECGALIKNIKEEWNGNISCVFQASSSNMELAGTMRLLVALAPGAPALLSTTPPTFKGGDMFMAQCVVPNGRPAAKITWFLGEKQLLHGTYEPVVTSEPGSDLQTISQIVKVNLTNEDDAKMLVCRAEHEALEKPLEAREQLILHYTSNTILIILSSIFGIAWILLGVITIWKRHRVKRNPAGTPQLPIINEPSGPFYLNMLFRRECDQEIAEIGRHHYEEVGQHHYDEVGEHPNEEIENIYEEIDPQELVTKRVAT